MTPGYRSCCADRSGRVGHPEPPRISNRERPSRRWARRPRDKGVEELVEAFLLLRQKFADIILLVVGDYETRDQPSEKTKHILATHEAVRHVGWQTDVVPFMAALDIFVLPTYREGLGTVLLEAAAMGIPTVTTKATGARDAIVDGSTGLGVPIANVGALTEALARLVQDASLRDAMGRAGCAWVSKHFDRSEVWRRQAEEYRSLLGGAKVYTRAKSGPAQPG